MNQNADDNTELRILNFSQGVLPIFIYEGVCMERKIQTQKHGFPEKFAPKNIGILHISYKEIWVKIVLLS